MNELMTSLLHLRACDKVNPFWVAVAVFFYIWAFFFFFFQKKATIFEKRKNIQHVTLIFRTFLQLIYFFSVFISKNMLKTRLFVSKGYDKVPFFITSRKSYYFTRLNDKQNVRKFYQVFAKKSLARPGSGPMAKLGPLPPLL